MDPGHPPRCSATFIASIQSEVALRAGENELVNRD
jgi:hypothetical protein